MPCQTKELICAFDLSLVATGFAVNINAGAYTIVSAETLNPPAKMTGIARLDWILTQVKHRTVGYTEPAVHFVVFEDLAFAAHDRNHERAGLATLIRHMLWENRIPFVLVAPTTLKKFTCGSGKADKSQMMLAVFKNWGVTPRNDNEADAIALLKLGEALVLPDNTHLPKYQQECLAVVRKSLQYII